MSNRLLVSLLTGVGVYVSAPLWQDWGAIGGAVAALCCATLSDLLIRVVAGARS